MTMNRLDPCTTPTPDPEPILDPSPAICPDPTDPASLRQTSGRPDMGWNDEPTFQDTGLGKAWNRDPIQAGKIINDLQSPDRNVVYRYTQALRGCDEAMTDLFRGIVVQDNDGKVFPVPIVWGSQEKAVAAILQDNYRKDNSNVVDRLRLPMMAIMQRGLTYDPTRYIYHKAIDYMREYGGVDLRPGFTKKEKYYNDTIFGVSRGLPYNISYSLYLWVKFEEDYNQIIEQILLKFDPMAYIRVKGVGYEINVKLDQIGDNRDLEPGDKNLRVLKFEFSMTAEMYIPQPIVRKKAVLKTRMEILDGLTDDEALSVISRLEDAVKELE